MTMSRLGLIVILNIFAALMVPAGPWGPVAPEPPAPAVDSAKCINPIGSWSFAAQLRDRQNGYVVRRILMELAVSRSGDEIEAAIRRWAIYYEVSDTYALCVARRESHFVLDAVGDDGNAIGLWQFWLPTWEMFRKKMKATTDDQREDLNESTRTAMWAFANGYARHWAPVKRGLCESAGTG